MFTIILKETKIKKNRIQKNKFKIINSLLKHIMSFKLTIKNIRKIN
jgi:hypothetical protein